MNFSFRLPFVVLLLSALSVSNQGFSQVDTNAIELNIFPNPNRGTFYITVVGEESYYSHLYDMSGKLIRNLYLQPGLNYISIIEEPGIYFLKLGEEKELSQYKIVIN